MGRESAQMHRLLEDERVATAAPCAWYAVARSVDRTKWGLYAA
jgi:hypothetical protein